MDKTLILDGNLFAKMVRGAAANLNQNKTVVNDLNVFPVPDGDTGDNMYMTISSGKKVTNALNDCSLGEVSEQVAKAMLLGARGNSGVILSRIFAGIAQGFMNIHSANLQDVAKAFKVGVEEAYKAVSVPVEGTILTVYKDAVEYANSRINNNSSLESYFKDLYYETKVSLEKTPELLQVLKDAGVVDSGGAGFVYIAEGMRKALSVDDVEDIDEDLNTSTTKVDISKFNENSELEYGYCTEFLLQLLTSKIDISKFDVNEIKDYLNSVGDSVVCFQDGTIVKVHVHTKTPGDILNHCQKWGEYLTLKIENMTIQNESANIQNRYVAKPKKLHKKYGVVTVAMGEGIKKTFKDMGVDYVVDGGQSMNPSAEDFIEAFDETCADTIFVYPNNSNIILTANQAASLYKDSKIIVIPSKTIGQGYGALSILDFSSNDIDTITQDALVMMEHVKTGIVSKANRDTVANNVTIHAGDFIGYEQDTIYVDSKIKNDVACKLFEKINDDEHFVVLVVSGKETKDKEVAELMNKLQKKFSDKEFIHIQGDQPIYDYILIME